MGLTNYTTLIAAKTVAGSIKRHVNYDKIDAEVVLENAQTLLYSLLRTREMRASANINVGATQYNVALPAGFLDPFGKLRDTQMFRYVQRSEDQLMGARSYDADGVLKTGQPTYWSIFDEMIQFDLKFKEDRTLFLPYYKQPDLLAASPGTNWLTNRYPHLLRQACLVQAHAFMKNWTGYNAELAVLTPMTERTNAEADLTYRGADLDQELC